LISPDGQRHPLVTMRELVPGTDRYGADVTVTSEGLWRFRVEAWGDPIAHWRHDAAIKIPRRPGRARGGSRAAAGSCLPALGPAGRGHGPGDHGSSGQVSVA